MLSSVDHDIVNDVIELAMKHQLHYFDVAIAGMGEPLTSNSRVVVALDDTGAEVVTGRSSIINQLENVEVIGSTRLAGITGESRDCPLVKIQVAYLKDEHGANLDLETGDISHSMKSICNVVIKVAQPWRWR